MKRILAILLALLMCFSLVACGAKAPAEEAPAPEAEAPAEEAPAEEAPVDPIVLRFSSAATGASTTAEAMEVFKKAIEEKSNGRILVEIYHSSSLVAQDAEVESVINGNIEMATADISFVTPYLPYLSMFSAAYFFESAEHADTVMNRSEIGKALCDRVADEIGVQPLQVWYDGCRVLSTRFTEPTIMTPDDMAGVILRMPNSDSYMFMGEVLGGNPTPLAFAELYTALNTGAVDAQDNPLPNIESSKCYEVTGQISLTNHLVGNVWPMINKQVWDDMGAELQGLMMEAIDEAGKYMMETNKAKEARLVEFFESEGIKVVEPDRAAFIARAEEMYLNSSFAETWDMDLYAEIKALA
ncbi:MAG: DctP family TRAP transporter solute-binding subunit [Oscillospiraceae bacterium]|nr:DctP family TRAP transporter solute-binding subunit [Oscillospiraceae bacterium]